MWDGLAAVGSATLEVLLACIRMQAEQASQQSVGSASISSSRFLPRVALTSLHSELEAVSQMNPFLPGLLSVMVFMKVRGSRSKDLSDVI